MEPRIVKGGRFADYRGVLSYNNDFDASQVKRIYFIENIDVNFIRAWQGHKIEQRWFSAVQGSFEVKLIKVDNWETPSKTQEPYVTTLNSEILDILHVPAGYISSIQALVQGAKLLVMADYLAGEIKDEYRYDAGYFNDNK